MNVYLGYFQLLVMALGTSKKYMLNSDLNCLWLPVVVWDIDRDRIRQINFLQLLVVV